ncbi:MAG: hypothetical protein WCP11_00635 [Candidatus Saccharibacteria bacterium]
MDIQPQSIKPISDDQELAKVLAGITGQPGNVGFEETPTLSPATTINTSSPVVATPTITPDLTPAVDYTPPMQQSTVSGAPETDSSDLESIKKDALLELRPLVDRLDLAADEKFDIYLLLLRSTDDKTLIAPAHKAAAEITDESRKAQALLDVIKEIDYLSNAKSIPSQI